MGYDPVVRHPLRNRKEYQHAFMDVARQVHVLLEKGEPAIPPLKEALERCSQAVRWVRSRRSSERISLGLTHRLVKIQQLVQRMHLLVQLLEAILHQWSPKAARDLFFEILLSELRRFELRAFLSQNVRLLAFQITEHTGGGGEHYITRTRSERVGMFRSAALGGAVVSLLAIFKIVASKLHLPPGPEALANDFIYASGFVAIHALGATLATKQPAMTASHLASLMDEATDSHSAMEKLADIIVRTIRSQMVALFGNFMLAFPCAVLITWSLIALKIPLIGPDKAQLTLNSLHAWKSWSFMYAAVAGVCLFVSGLLAGFADNWFVFNDVGARLRHSGLLKRFVKPQNLDRAVQYIDHNLGFLIGNISLGFFLGSMPAIGAIMGLPLDIRHITFASAQAGIAMTTLNFSIPVSEAVIAGLTIFGIGLINLAVSFSLTLFVVVKSRSIKFPQTPLLIRKLGRRFRARPLEFLIPPRDVV